MTRSGVDYRPMEASSIVAYTGRKISQRDSANQIQPPVFKRAVEKIWGKTMDSS